MDAAIIIYIVVSLIIFIVCREVLCWYFKINATLAELKEISGHMAEANHILKAINANAVYAAEQAVPVVRGHTDPLGGLTDP